MGALDDKRHRASSKFWDSMQAFRNLYKLLATLAEWELASLAV